MTVTARPSFFTAGASALQAAPASGFPATRLRRPRQAAWSRALVAETTLTPANLIWPIFVADGEKTRQPVASMPGVERFSVDLVAEAAEQAAQLGIPAIALFPYTRSELRDEAATEAFNPENLVCRAVRAIKGARSGYGHHL